MVWELKGDTSGCDKAPATLRVLFRVCGAGLGTSSIGTVRLPRLKPPSSRSRDGIDGDGYCYSAATETKRSLLVVVKADAHSHDGEGNLAAQGSKLIGLNLD